MAQEKGSRQAKLDGLLGRALRDKDFRERLLANPADVAKEAGLSAEELELVAGGLAVGGAYRDPSSIMYCTEKTCNEKGGARVVMWTPVEDQPLFQTPADVPHRDEKTQP
jgi:hypothetical protein